MEKSLAKNSLFSILYNISNILFPLITSIYASRVLRAEGIGAVSYSANIVSYFSALAVLGLPTYGVREIAKSRKNQTQTNKVFSELIFINTISTTLAVILYFMVIFKVHKFHKDLVLYLVCGIQLVLNYINIDWLFQGYEEYAYIAYRSITVKLISLVLVVIFVKNSNDYIIYALISSMALTGNYLLNLKRLPKLVSFTFNQIELRHHIRPLLVLALSIFLSTAYSRIDVTMLGAYGNNTTIGLYTNAHRIVEVTTIISTSISAVFLPRLSYYYNTDRKTFDELINKGIGVLCFISLPLFIGLVIMAPRLIGLLFGDGFIEGAETVRYFSPLVIIKSFGNLLCYQLVIATGNENKRLPAYIVGALTNIVLNYLLIPVLYQNGAAIASVISEIAVNGIQFYAMCRIVKISFPRQEFMQGVVSSVLMGGIVIILYRLGNSVLNTFLCIFVGGVVYMSLNYIMHNTIIDNFINFIKD